MMSKQEKFDFVVQKIVEQGTPCIENGYCSYLNEKGQRCSAGWLMTEDEAKNAKDGYQYLDASIHDRIGDKDFVIVLQSAHDRAFLTENFRKGWLLNMQQIAFEHSLDLSELQRLATNTWLSNWVGYITREPATSDG